MDPPRVPDGRAAAVGYLVERYPVVSQTFVTNEVAELRRQGVRVLVASLWAGDTVAGAAPPDIVVTESRPRLRRKAVDHLAAAVQHPVRYVRFLATIGSLRSEAAQVGWTDLPTLARRLRAAGVDRLHAHFAWGGAAAAAALATLTGWPWALTVHARDIFAERRNLELKLRRTDRLITVCEFNRRYLLDNLGYRGPSEIVVCGVVVPGELPGPPDLGVLFVGRLVEKKGLDVLLRALAELYPRLPELTLDVIGDGPLLAPMRRLAAELGVAAAVTFRGELGHDETLDLIGRATLLCLPARLAADGDVDSMPVVIKEAMVRGVAVAASDAGGVAEMISDGCGELVPAEDPGALAAAIERLWIDPTYRARCAERARERAVGEFSLPEQVGRLARILAALSQ